MEGLRVKLWIGWAEEDATPQGKVDLYGQYYHRVSAGIHSRLTVTALALESENGEQATLVSLEIAGCGEDFVAELRARLRAEVPDVDPARVILNTTHTHNAPAVDVITGIEWLTELPDCLPASEYRRFLLGRTVQAIAAARRERKPGGIAHVLAAARVGHCRRAVYANGTAEMYGRTDRDDFIGMEGGEDSGVDLLFTFDTGGVPTGVVLNLACPAQVMEATYQLSSDFIGETRRRLKECFGGPFRVMGQVSAAGCQSPRDLTRNYKGEPDFWHTDGVAELGARLAAAVERACQAAACRVDRGPILRHVASRVSLPRRRASPSDYREAKAELARLEAVLPEGEAYRQFCEEVRRNERIPGRPGPYDSKLHHFVLIQNNRAVVQRYESQEMAPRFDVEMHVLRLGAVVLATNPFELYLDFGQRIKARSLADQTFVVQLCCGSGGYLPSARAEQLGGYGGLIINGMVGSDGGARLVDTTVAAIASLWGQP
jgi:hypothetical protein